MTKPEPDGSIHSTVPSPDPLPTEALEKVFLTTPLTVEDQGQPTRVAVDPLLNSLGRFVLDGEIGRGGMGCVFRGHDPELDRELAIKELRP